MKLARNGHLTTREWIALLAAVLGGAAALTCPDVAALYAFVFPVVPVTVSLIAGKKAMMFGAITAVSTWFWCGAAQLFAGGGRRIDYWDIFGWLPLFLGMSALFCAPIEMWQRYVQRRREKRHEQNMRRTEAILEKWETELRGKG